MQLLSIGKLNKTETNIIEALNGEMPALEQLAARTGCEVSGYFMRTVASLSKRGILGNKKSGYSVQPKYLKIVNVASAKHE